MQYVKALYRHHNSTILIIKKVCSFQYNKHYETLSSSVYLFFNITLTDIVLAQPSFNDVDILKKQGQLTQAYTLLKTLERSGKFDEKKLKLAKVLRKQNRYADVIIQQKTTWHCLWSNIQRPKNFLKHLKVGR